MKPQNGVKVELKQELRLSQLLTRALIGTSVLAVLLIMGTLIFQMIRPAGNAYAAYSSSIIWQETFSYPDYTSSSSKWTINNSSLTLNSGDIFEVYYSRFEIKDIDGEGVWTSEVIDISEYTDVYAGFTVYEEGTMEAGDYFRTYYKLNGGSEVPFEYNGNLSDDFTSAQVLQTGLNGSTLQIVVRAMNNDDGEFHHFDNIEVKYDYQISTCNDTLYFEPFNYAQNTNTSSMWVLDISGAASGFLKVRSGVMEATDTDGPVIFKTVPIYIGEYVDLAIRFDLTESGPFEPADTVATYYRIDGGAWTEFPNSGVHPGEFGSVIPTAFDLHGDSLEIMVRMINSTTNEHYEIDNILVTGCPSPVNNTIYRLPLSVDNSMVCGILTDFTTLVSIADEELKHKDYGGLVLNASGADISFVNGDGHELLDFELQDYDPVNGEVTAWVKLPTVSSSAPTDFYIYYGDPSLNTSLSSSDAWDNNYKGVWHFADGDLSDATSNGNNGTNGGSTSGIDMIGDSRSYDGSNDYIDNGGMDISGTAMTISTWFYANSFGSYPRIVSKAVGTSSSGGYWEIFVNSSSSSTGQLNFRLRTSTGVTTLAAGNISSGQVYHVAATYNGSTMRLYLNGTQVGSVGKSGSIIVDSGINMRFGGNPSSATIRPWNGYIDEVRISSVSRSANWICTEESNQEDPTNFVTIAGPSEFLGTDETALPIELLSFDAEAQNNGTVLCEWASNIEIDNDYYTIERSNDGKDFETVGEVSGAGNSTQRIDYSFVDEQPIQGLSYYRLRQTDYNGETETFAPVAVTIEPSTVVSIQGIKVGPNPFTQEFTLFITAVDNEQLSMEMIAVDGRVVQKQKLEVNSGQNSIPVYCGTDIPAGQYLLNLYKGVEVVESMQVNKLE